jgi:hypothetical protein
MSDFLVDWLWFSSTAPTDRFQSASSRVGTDDAKQGAAAPQLFGRAAAAYKGIARIRLNV